MSVHTHRSVLRQQNLGFITDYALTFFPDRIALLQDDLRLTYRQFDERANRVAQGIARLGVGRGERVLIIWQNDIRFLETVLGTIRSGAIAVPVNSALSIEKHRELLEDCGARVVIASSAAAKSVAAFVDDDLVDAAVVLGSADERIAEYEDWLGRQPSDRPDVEVDADDVAWQAYTSGSTGKPKGVLISHRMLLKDASLVSSAMFIEPSDRVLVSTPLFHMNASAVGLLPCLYSGGSAYVLPGFDPDQVLETIHEHRCTYISGVPAMYKLLLARSAERSDLDLSSITLVLCGSAPMPEAVLDDVLTMFPNATFCEGYGLTEVGPVLTLVPRVGVRKLGSIGMPLRGVEVAVIGFDGTEVPTGETGELWVRTEIMTLGYHRRPEENERKFKPDGWFATGDLVTIDEAGWVYFRGRADDRMNVGGENVYPAEVESILVEYPGVRDVSVVSREHDVKGEVPIAFVVLEAGASVAEDELKQFFLHRGPAYAHPREVVFLPSLPLSGTGKVDRATLTRQAAATRAGV